MIFNFPALFFWLKILSHTLSLYQQSVTKVVGEEQLERASDVCSTNPRRSAAANLPRFTSSCSFYFLYFHVCVTFLAAFYAFLSSPATCQPNNISVWSPSVFHNIFACNLKLKRGHTCRCFSFIKDRVFLSSS